MRLTSSGGADGSWTMDMDPSLSLNFKKKTALNCPSFRKQSGVKLFAQPDINKFSESELKWRVAKYGDTYSEFVLCI